MRAILQHRASAIARCAVPFARCGPCRAQAPAPSSAPTKHQIQAAEDAYLAGARLLDHEDLSAAEIQFDKAAKLNPSNSDYAMAYSITHQRHITELVRQSGKARLLGQNEKAETLLAEARLLDPQNSIVGQSVDPGALPKVFHPKIEPWIREGPAIAGPVTLLPNPGPKSFHLHSDEQEVIRQALSGYGICTTLDTSVS